MTATQRSPWPLLLALTLFALGLRLFNLDLRSIWLDEAYSLNLARADWAGILWGAKLDIHPPLYHLLLAGWIRLFGTSEWAARSLSVLFGALLVPVAFLLARSLADRKAAWWTAALVAVSPYFVELSRSARMGALLALFTALSWYFFLQVIRGRGLLAAAGYVLCSLAALYTHYFAFLLVFTQSAYLFMGLKQLHLPRPVRQSWLYLQLLLLAGYAPWLPALYHHAVKGGPAWRGVGADWTEPLHSFWAFAVGTACWSLTDKVLALAALVGAGIFTVWRLFPVRREVAARLAPRDWGQLAAVLVIPLGLVLLYSCGRLNVFDDRYLSFCALAGLVVAAVLLSSLPKREGMLAGVLVLAGFAVPLHNQGFVYGYYDNWRAVTADLSAAARDGDEVAVYPAWNETPLQYYLRERLPVQGLPGHYDPVLGQAEDDFPIDQSNVHTLKSRFDPPGRVWLVLVNFGAPQDALRAWLGARSRLISERRYGDIQLLEYAPPGPP